MTDKLPFHEVLKALKDESQPFPARYLQQFSDLEGQPLRDLLKVWPALPLARKVNLLEDLESLAEDETLMCFDDLAQALLDDPQGEVRKQAIRLLWECEQPRVARKLLKMLTEDSDIEVRAAAASGLGLFVYLGELETIPASLLEEIENLLLKTARGKKDPLVRRKALEALGTSSRPEVPELIEKAFASPETEWQKSALFAMGRSNDQRWNEQVLAKLHNPDNDVREEAIRAAGELSLPESRSVLLHLLDEEEDSDLTHTIIWSLSQIGGEGVRHKLEGMLEDIADVDEEDFLEEALENLNLTDEMASFNLMDIEGENEFDLEKEGGDA